MYAADAKLADLSGAAGAALSRTWTEKANVEKEQADEIRKSTEELDADTRHTARRASLFDGAEVFLEIAIVLCSIALLTGTRFFWQVSFVGAAIGVVIAAFGWV